MIHSVDQSQANQDLLVSVVVISVSSHAVTYPLNVYGFVPSLRL
jgi:hypothetical protein